MTELNRRKFLQLIPGVTAAAIVGGAVTQEVQPTAVEVVGDYDIVGAMRAGMIEIYGELAFGEHAPRVDAVSLKSSAQQEALSV